MYQYKVKFCFQNNYYIIKLLQVITFNVFTDIFLSGWLNAPKYKSNFKSTLDALSTLQFHSSILYFVHF